LEDDGSSLTAAVQRKLKRLGYYTGAVDGELGRGTRAAIRAYQEENDLEVTGQINRALLRSLGL
jgi:peptidoglycan hydrolase-like protein with peptidoglycan-binding domain